MFEGWFYNNALYFPFEYEGCKVRCKLAYLVVLSGHFGLVRSGRCYGWGVGWNSRGSGRRPSRSDVGGSEGAEVKVVGVEGVVSRLLDVGFQLIPGTKPLTLWTNDENFIPACRGARLPLGNLQILFCFSLLRWQNKMNRKVRGLQIWSRHRASQPFSLFHG